MHSQLSSIQSMFFSCCCKLTNISLIISLLSRTAPYLFIILCTLRSLDNACFNFAEVKGSLFLVYSLPYASFGVVCVCTKYFECDCFFGLLQIVGDRSKSIGGRDYCVRFSSFFFAIFQSHLFTSDRASTAAVLSFCLLVHQLTSASWPAAHARLRYARTARIVKTDIIPSTCLGTVYLLAICIKAWAYYYPKSDELSKESLRVQVTRVFHRVLKCHACFWFSSIATI